MKKLICIVIAIIICVMSVTAFSSEESALDTNNINGEIFDIEYANNSYIGVGYHGVIIKSNDGGKTWIEIETDNTTTLRGVTWVGNKYVAVGELGTILTSIDGMQWTKRESGTVSCFCDIIWNGETMVAVGTYGTIITSKDGINWTLMDSKNELQLRCISWTGSLYIIGGENGIILTSYDSENWETIPTSINNTIMDIIWVEEQSKYIAVGHRGTIITSSDGINWHKEQSNVDVLLACVLWNGDHFAAFGGNGDYSTGTIIISADGIHWQTIKSGLRYGIRDVHYSNNQYILAGGYLGTGVIEIEDINEDYQLNTEDNSQDIQDSIINESINSNAKYIKVEAGHTHTIALKDDGSVWSWGSNSYGELGNGTFEDSTVPVKVKNLTDVQMISAGANHNVALKNDGTAWCWGYNNDGQLGNNTKMNSSVPVKVTGLKDIEYISTGYSFSFAIKNDGTIWCWGNNCAGQLSDFTLKVYSYKDWSEPVQAKRIDNAISVTGGNFHSIAIKENGTIWCWGASWGGALAETEIKYPIQVKALEGIKSIDAGNIFNIALKDDGTVFSWGVNDEGQLGNGNKGQDTSNGVPELIKGLNNVSLISAGHKHVVVLTANGDIYGWGNAEAGQLGDVGNQSTSLPLKLTPIPNVIDISAGKNHTVALTEEGKILSWGENRYGQLGDGTHVNSIIPVNLAKHSLYCIGSEDTLDISSWAKKAVEKIWINDLADPIVFAEYQKSITREEFASLAVRLYEKATGNVIEVKDNQPFTDIDDCIFAKDIVKANSIGVVNGVGNNKYDPYRCITRQEISVMIYNLVQALHPERNMITTDNIGFLDDSQISNWARPAVLYLYKNGIMKGVADRVIAPLSNATREQAMVLIYEVGVSENTIVAD